MGTKYTIPIDAVASPAAQFDAFELNVASTRAVRLLKVTLGQTSDVGDANAENVKVQIITGHSTSGSGGSAPTPNPIGNGGACASTAETMNTTIASTGTAVTRHQSTWTTQLPFDYRPTPDEIIELAPSARLVVRIGAPADAITVSGELVFEEIGG